MLLQKNKRHLIEIIYTCVMRNDLLYNVARMRLNEQSLGTYLLGKSSINLPIHYLIKTLRYYSLGNELATLPYRRSTNLYKARIHMPVLWMVRMDHMHL